MADGTEPPEGKQVEKDPVLAEINKKVEDAFDVFDHEGNKTVDVRSVTLYTYTSTTPVQP